MSILERGQQGRVEPAAISLRSPGDHGEATGERLTWMAMSALVPMGSAVSSSPCSSTVDHPDAGKENREKERGGEDRKGRKGGREGRKAGLNQEGISKEGRT